MHPKNGNMQGPSLGGTTLRFYLSFCVSCRLRSTHRTQLQGGKPLHHFIQLRLLYRIFKQFVKKGLDIRFGNPGYLDICQ